MLSVVIPAFNEAERLPLCLLNTVKFLKEQEYDSEIIIVCDGCTDNTAEEAVKFKKEYDNLRVIEYSPNRGKGYAVKKGMLEANGELRLFMDADYAVPIETIIEFKSQIQKGFDIVMGGRGLKGTKVLRHQWFLRELAGRTFGRIQKTILHIPFHDTQCGFKLFTAKAAGFLFPKLRYECSYFDAESIYIAYLSGMKIKEMPVVWKHDGITRMPVGFDRSIDLFKKLLRLKKLHRENLPFRDE